MVSDMNIFKTLYRQELAAHVFSTSLFGGNARDAPERLMRPPDANHAKG